MSASLKYGLARLGLFVVCAVPVLFLLPGVDLLIRLLIALALSATLALVFLRGLRDRVSDDMISNRDRRQAEKARLRAALSGDETPQDPVG
jgi:membrane protein implicated in regulation of membrane protease activity